MRRRPAVLLLVLLLPSGARAGPLVSDGFDAPRIDAATWTMTSDGAFRELVIDARDADPSDLADRRLRLRADTMGTAAPMKYLGVRSTKPFDFAEPKTISCDIDWNDQANGCYLSAAIYVCATESDNPRSEPTWIAFEYTGVPPGRNLRTNVWVRRNNSLAALYEDWGPRDERGRPVGRAIGGTAHRITLILDADSVEVLEDGKTLIRARHSLRLEKAYVYLQMASGTNYPSREIYFDNVEVAEVGGR